MIKDSDYIPEKGEITAIYRFEKYPCLTLGKEYSVDYVLLGRSWSRVCLSEFPDCEFDRHYFTFHINGKQIDIIEDYFAIIRLSKYTPIIYTTLMICRNLSEDRLNQVMEWRGRYTRIINRWGMLEDLRLDEVENEEEKKFEISTEKNIKAANITLLGAICGDIIGSYYESHSHKYRYDFKLFRKESRFTDDTVCSIGIASALIKKGTIFSESSQYWVRHHPSAAFRIALLYWCRKYPCAGYGTMFKRWINSDSPLPYNSYGNGSAMRVSSIGAYADTLDEVMDLSKQSAEITHNHPEGIKGAQATATAIFLALHGKTKDEIKSMIESIFGYDLSRKYDDVMRGYGYDVSCQGSVPESIISFLESNDYESAIRKAIALGGDADTMGAIAGGIAAAYYGEIPQYIIDECLDRLPDEFITVIKEFNELLRPHLISLIAQC